MFLLLVAIDTFPLPFPSALNFGDIRAANIIIAQGNITRMLITAYFLQCFDYLLVSGSINPLMDVLSQYSSPENMLEWIEVPDISRF